MTLDPRKLRLCFAGSFGFRDIGDEAMLTETLAFLRDDLGLASENLYLFGRDHAYLSHYHEVPQANLMSWITTGTADRSLAIWGENDDNNALFLKLTAFDIER